MATLIIDISQSSDNHEKDNDDNSSTDDTQHQTREDTYSSKGRYCVHYIIIHMLAVFVFKTRLDHCTGFH